ncbi:MAG TPA: DNA-directed RNA polymerase subunit omega [Pyrinomonadaceae bacterium]|nr:DNA-directed RNA polymerase subunit omega [Pyrinomonadaceae bacterium]
MDGTDKTAGSDPINVRDEGTWPGIDSRFRLIVVSALRSKQLQRGALPRIAPDTLKRRNTSIALEEVKRGLVPFTITLEDKKANGNDNGSQIGLAENE